MGALDLLMQVQDYTDAVRVFEVEPSQTLFQDLFNVNKKVCVGPTVQWDETDFPRRLAPVVGDDSPFPAVNPNSKNPQAAPLIHLKVSKKLSAYQLLEWRYAGLRDADVRRAVEDELAGMIKIVKSSVEYICANALLGSINTANIQGSEYVVTFTYNVTAQTIGAWSVTTTDLVGVEIPKISQKYVQVVGRQPGVTIINDAQQQLILQNTTVKAWMQYQHSMEAVTSSMTDEQVINARQFGGLDWRKSFGGYVPDGGNFTRFMPSNTIITLPLRSSLGELLTMAEGYGAIPTNMYGAGDAAGASTAFRRAGSPGLYAYSVGTHNPAGVELYVGYRFFPVVKYGPGVLVTTTT